MRTRVQGQGYSHPFATANLKGPLTTEEKILVVKTGQWELLIESHMRLACSIAGRYVRFGGNSDEMVSAAMLGIVEAVDRFKKGEVDHDNVTGYIIHYIHQHCTRTLQQDCLIPIPRPSRKKIIICPITDAVIAPDEKISELYEVIESITETEAEKMIVFLRQQGYSDYEIAERLNLVRSTVTRIRQRLLERYNVVIKCE